MVDNTGYYTTHHERLAFGHNLAFYQFTVQTESTDTWIQYPSPGCMI